LGFRQDITEDPYVSVRNALQSSWPEVSPSDRDGVARRLAECVTGAPAARRFRLLAELPGALIYHAEAVRSRSVAAIPSADGTVVSRSQEGLLKTGFALQADYLVERVRRASLRRESPELSAECVRQVEGLADAVRSTLKTVLLGEAAARVLDVQVDSLRRSWVSSLASSYNAFLDQPLSSGDYERVLAGIRAAPGEFVPFEPQAAELEEGGRGVGDLISRVREAAYGATRLCYRSYEPFEREFAEWERTADAELGRLLAALPVEEGVRDSGSRLVHVPRPGLQEPVQPRSGFTAPSSLGGPPPERPEGRARSRLGAAILLGLATLAVILLWRSRGRSLP
jgi:hypothetical protein